MYLVAVIDWHSRYVLAWQLSNHGRCLHRLPARSQRSGQHGRPWPRTTSSANAYGAASSMRTSISTIMTRCANCKLAYATTSTSTTMRDRIKVSTIGLQLKSTSCSDQSRPHPSGCTLFLPFRGPNIGTHYICFWVRETLDTGSIGSRKCCQRPLKDLKRAASREKSLDQP